MKMYVPDWLQTINLIDLKPDVLAISGQYQHELLSDQVTN